MFKSIILEDLKKAVKDLGYESSDIVISISKNSSFGDYTTNIALQLSKLNSENGKQNPDQIAKKIIQKIDKKDYLEKVDLENGFINFYIKINSLAESIDKVCNYSAFVNPALVLETSKGKKILVEFAHPNTHKAFHIGHVRNITLGESVVRLLEANGNDVFRANYQGDIGLHVAKALWGLKNIGVINLDKAKDLQEKAEFLGKAYALGAKNYAENEEVAKEIQEINKALYARDPSILALWEKTRQLSLDYFDDIYQKLGTKFDRLFFESEVEVAGKKIVEDNLGKVFETSEGAVIFKGEDYGLHSRVFITSAGNPTYEAKDLGLAYLEKDAFQFDIAVHVVGTDQSGYFQVMLRALTAIDDWFAGKEKHLPYGMVNLTSGKMSSRTGEVVTFDWLFDEVGKRVSQVMTKNQSERISKEEKQQIISTVSIGAIKFNMLKYAPQTDITFDLEKSVSLQGDSGPYIQYTYARAKSVLRTAIYNYRPTNAKHELEIEERELLRMIEHFHSIIEMAASEFKPNIIATFLLDFAKAFNLFYQKHPIIKAEEKTEFRLALTCAVAVVLKQGLYLLGIEAPERM